MGIPLTRATAREVRAAIATAVVGDRSSDPALGSVVLQQHQRAALARVRAALTEFGGALLADATGLGKTYVALGVARDAHDPVIVAPAGLRDMWRTAMTATGAQHRFISLEALGRRGSITAMAAVTPDLVIVDEAHHARNPATARYRALSALTRDAKVLLLSATPIHNSERDLRALLALFLGARASVLDAGTAMRCVIRRTASESTARLPTVAPPERLHIPDDEARMNAIVALPPPTPPIDGGDGGILLVYSLLRRWASSQGALADSLRRRLARAHALLGALESGRYPSSEELSAWTYADGVMQLAFPELTVAAAANPAPASALCSTIRAHADAVRTLLDDLQGRADIDEYRVAHLRTIRLLHPTSRIVAFTQYAETVSTMFHHLRRIPGVGALTSSGARVAGGTLSRAEALCRFAPLAQGCCVPRRGEGIDVLLTTDLLSEGVNLQDASVVVHLDLPWTPARLEQRVGRVARIGSCHDQVAIYEMAPPASAERLVRVEERLRSKLDVSARAVGIAGTILPALGFEHHRPTPVSPPEWNERLASHVAGWMDPDAQPPTTPSVAAVHARVSGFIAVVRDEHRSTVVGSVGSEVSDDPALLLRAVAEACGVDSAVQPSELARAWQQLHRWRSTHRDRSEITLDGALHARSRRAVVDRIAAIARRAPRHLRPRIVALAATARQTVTAHYGVGAEHVLEELAAAELPDEAWLRAIGAFGAIHDRRETSSSDPDHAIVALLLLVAPGDVET